MKYIVLVLMFQLLYNTNNAQVPQKISYQAVIRDASNNLLSLKHIGMRISIIKGDANGTPVYIETQEGITNLNGLISLQIGTGAILMGKFSSIDWSKGPYFVFTETDPDGGFDYRINGTSELLSVPFALYSATSNFDTTSMNNRLITTTDLSIANAKQIAINDGRINSKLNSFDTAFLLLNYQKVGNFVSSISLEGKDTFDISILGNFVASKNVTVGGNIESLGATSTLGTLEKPFKGLFISSGSLSIASDTLGKQIPAAVLSNVEGNLQISAGGLKLMGDNTSFIAPRIVSTLSGNASSATTLETARYINGVAFDGSKDIVIPSYTSTNLTFDNTGTGNVSGDTFNGINAKTISYNSIGASPVAGSASITTIGTLIAGSVPYSLLSGTIPTWNQSTSGNAATVTTNANLTGVVTSVGNVTSIASGTISNSMLANTAVANLSGTNTGDETDVTIKTKLGIATLSGSNTGDETTSTIKTKLGVTTLSGSNTGDQVLPTLVSLGAVAGNTAITGATKTKVTYDAKGLVTAGADATTADIAASTNKNYVTDIQSGVLSNTSGINTGDETNTTIKTKLGITSISGANTGDQTLPTLESLNASPLEGSTKLTTIGLLSKLTLSSNKSEDQQETIDLSISIHKLSGIGGRNYILNDGIEGQIIYILPYGDRTTFSDITISIENGTIWIDNQLVTSNKERPIIWSPFFDKRPSVTMVSAIFTENKWFINGGTSTH